MAAALSFPGLGIDEMAAGIDLWQVDRLLVAMSRLVMSQQIEDTPA